MSVLRSRCAVCGSKTESRSARREGRLWFCSQSCFLEHESRPRAFGRGSRHGRRRRILKRSILTVVVLFVALIVLAAVFGGTKAKTTAASHNRALTKSGAVRLRHVASIGGGWEMRVLSVRRNANRQVAAIVGEAPPAGAQYFVVKLALTYAGGGKGDANELMDFGLRAMGAHRAAYDLTMDSCGYEWPKPSLHDVTVVYSGGTVRGNVCFKIAKNDARTLMLYTGEDADARALGLLPNIKRVWFALR